MTKTLGADRLLWTVFAISAAVTAWTESEVVWLFLGSGVLVAFIRSARATEASPLALTPVWLMSGVHGAATPGTLTRMFWYFAEAGAFVFW